MDEKPTAPVALEHTCLPWEEDRRCPACREAARRASLIRAGDAESLLPVSWFQAKKKKRRPK